jgi:tRNA(Ile)-lysidine synthase
MSAEILPEAFVERVLAAWPLARWDGVHVLAAVSGGADSVALLRGLAAAKRLHGRDAGEARALAEARGDGVEEAAREERYRLLTEMAEEAGARYVATAHTRDDQAETVLFRFLRGSGLRGLSGMHAKRVLSDSVTLVRPLLGFSREELRSYLRGIGQNWREDATNEDFRFARNRIRGELLPYLREHFNSEINAALVHAAERFADAQELIESLAKDLLAACCVAIGPEGVTLDVAGLAGKPPLLAVEALRLAWRGAGWSEQSMTHRSWRQLAALAQADVAPSGLNLPGNVLARRDGAVLSLRVG